jgi:hypothetical protein
MERATKSSGAASAVPQVIDYHPRPTVSDVARFWWPLAASWLLMGAELPALSAVIARLPQPEIHLGAYGVVFALSLIVEAPIIMLLAASTALSKDCASYLKLRRFMMRLSAVETALHALVAFTPLFDLMMHYLIGLPDELMEPARIGLRIMTPWTWAIAYRRFNQGVLIRFDRTRVVGLGTVVRLTADVVVLAIGYLTRAFPGVVVGTSAVIAGVLSEALYVGLRVRPVLRNELRAAPPVEPPLSSRAMLEFYVPLALTSLMALAIQPIGSAALSRAPLPVESLAVWPVVSGLLFIFRSLGLAYNEVVVALLERPGSAPALRRFTVILTLVSTLPLAIIAATPLAQVWFRDMSGLSPELADLACASLPFVLALAALQPWMSWYQGRLVYGRRTRSVTESVVLFVIVTVGALWAGVAWGQAPGVFIGWTAFSLGGLAQTAWLWMRSRTVLETHASRS